ncbi:hypothetical protein ACROYT_G014636 [Oculina patagonica]
MAAGLSECDGQAPLESVTSETTPPEMTPVDPEIDTVQSLLERIELLERQNSREETMQEGAKTQYVTLPHLYAVQEWLLPYMKPIYGLNSFHSFVIVKNNVGKAVLHFKAWSTSQWVGEE